ncbi:DNA primase [Bacillus sp. UMB0893]|uniref:DNA primase n=1 Tax=Bacillus sp. UMB0893 TaxID=2066053 RepID=UPI000C790CCC|nr:DNA primase [Bacillus sp. UMB0893]PLR68168.1 DNA primase [Bacillus sp. UMB0893]
MTNRIPDEIIEKIQQSADIVDVVSEYVQLKKQGRNHFGLCPFHGEKSPSFSVSHDKQIYHCFGCGAGGNVFSFLMQIEGYSFVEAALALADKLHIDLPDQINPVQPKDANSENEKMIEAHELLKKFYHHLLVNTNEGQAALDYLTSRGFTKESIEQFEIGYALDSWDFVAKFLTKRGYNPQLMEKAGLLVKKSSSDQYLDRFRNRIMFPIVDHGGRPIAFSGRVLGKEQPKYLNSPETPIFNKSKVLYNFHNARVHIRKNQQVVLFEGFADVISAVRSGVQHSIATMGTSLTEAQAKIIKRNAGDVIICYDSDSAGLEATLRASKTLAAAGCKMRVAALPDGTDPDDYIRTHGPEKFKKDVIGASITLMAFKMQFFRKGKNLQDEGQRLQYIEEILKELSLLENPVEIELYLKQLSGEFSLSMDVLKSQMQEKKLNKKPEREKEQQTALAASAFKPQQRRLLPAFHNAERLLIAHMLRNREIAQKVLDRIGLQFNIEEHRAIITYLYAYYEEGNEASVSSFLRKLPGTGLHQFVSDIAMLSVNEDISERELADYIKQVLNHQNWLMIKEKEAEKLEAERQKDFVKAANIAMEVIRLKRDLK